MQVEYKKDFRHSYMIMPIEEKITTSEYCIKLLEHQKVEGVLALERRVIDNQRMLYYEITSKQTLQNILVKTTLSYSQLHNLCEHILLTLERAYEYLLPEDDFILSPEYIYLNISNFEVDICFYPGYQRNIRDQIRGVMEYLMNKVDYTDKEAVLLVYQLYAISREDGYHFEELKELMTSNTNQKELEKGKNIKSHLEKNEPFEKDNKDPKVSFSYNMNKGMGIKEFEPEAMATEIKKSAKKQVPALEEKIEGEKEVTLYPWQTYLYLIGLILAGIGITIVCVTSRVLYNSFGNRIDYSKIFAFCLILFCVEGYLFQKVLNKRNRITKMVKTQEYIKVGSESYDNKSEKDQSLAKKQIEKEGQESLLIKKDIIGRKVGLNLNRLNDNILTNRSLNNKAVMNKEAMNNEVMNKASLNKEAMNNEVMNKMAMNKMAMKKAEKSHSKQAYENEERINHKVLNKDVIIESDEAHSYQDELVREYGIEGNDNQDHSYNPTCLLNTDHRKIESSILKSLNGAYPNIIIEHYPFFIGKFRNNVDYCIEKDVISRYHAKITWEGEEYFLTDLNSTNGTFLNGELLLTYQKKEIKAGDQITFADLRYEFWVD